MGLVGYDWAPLGVDLATTRTRRSSSATSPTRRATSGSRAAALAAECLATGKELLVTPEQALHVLEIITAARESPETGKRIAAHLDLQMADRGIVSFPKWSRCTATQCPPSVEVFRENILRRILALAPICVFFGRPRAAGDDLPGVVVHSWLANSFATEQGHQSVPVNVCGICVTPDGTVFSAGVSEAFGGVGSYKDGRFVTKYDYDSGFGSSASSVAADDDYVYIGTEAGLFRTRRGDCAYNRTPIVKGNLHGLALRDGELYLSDYDAGKIRVLATATMKEVRAIPVLRPGPLTVGADGRVWVIQGKPSKEPYLSFYTGGLKIIPFSKDGDAGPEIEDFENPCALAVDAKGRLLVGGLNRHSQVWIYDVSGRPNRVGTFGAEGGIFSGEPGKDTEEVPLDPRPGDRRGGQPLRRERLRLLVQRVDRGVLPLGPATLGRAWPG